jgi:predicted transposase/invertase (TIGR01784 family)
MAYISKINKRNDYAFKRIFGHEDTKDILARFLTVILSIQIEPEELSLIHTELSPEYLADKASVLDIQVKRSGFHEKMNIEMQVSDEGNIKKRILHYWGRGYTEELREGQDYEELPRMINIVITDFDVFEWSDACKFHSVFHVLDRDEGVLFSDALEIHVIELPKLRRQPVKSDWTPEECWALYIDNLEGEAMDRIAEKEPLISRAMTVEELFVKNAEERNLYELREKGRRIYESAIRKAERDGEARGEARGRAKGIEEGEVRGRAKGIAEGEARGEARIRRQTARLMLMKGIELDTISNVTGLQIDEIKAILAESPK